MVAKIPWCSADVCRQAGIEDSVLVVSNLEYSAFTEWVDRNKPPKLEIINTGQDIEWLVKHPQMLFPQDSNTAAQWFHIVQHRGQAKYYKAHELDMILLGRRRAVETTSEKGAIYIRTEKVSHVLVLWLIGAMKKYWHISIITIW